MGPFAIAYSPQDECVVLSRRGFLCLECRGATAERRGTRLGHIVVHEGRESTWEGSIARAGVRITTHRPVGRSPPKARRAQPEGHARDRHLGRRAGAPYETAPRRCGA